MAKQFLNIYMIACLVLYLGLTGFLVFYPGNIYRLGGSVFNETKVRPERNYCGQANTTYTWKKLADELSFSRNYCFQLFSHKNTLCAFYSAGNLYILDGKYERRHCLKVSRTAGFLDFR